MGVTGMAGAHTPAMINDEWLTPPQLLTVLGYFDLDPCSPVDRPWDTAKKHYTINDNGLLQNWEGRVWLNPPYGKYTTEWVNKLALHGRGTALIFARTDAGLWQDVIFPHADALLFLRGRLKFYTVDGKEAKENAGAPSVLVAFGRDDAERLRKSRLKGKFIML